jgi:hypothetical protein
MERKLRRHDSSSLALSYSTAQNPANAPADKSESTTKTPEYSTFGVAGPLARLQSPKKASALPNVQRQKQVANLQPNGKFFSRRQILLKMMDNRASTQPMAANFMCYAFLSFAERTKSAGTVSHSLK